MGMTFKLAGLIILSFIIQLIIPHYTEAMIFDPTKALIEPWRFITSIFVHAGFLHIFFNLYAFILFGPLVERKLGEKKFLLLFLVSGVIGSILYYLTVLLGIAPPIPALGASGAIFGIIGAATVFYPNMVIYVWFFPMRMREAAIMWIVLEFIGMFDIGSGIASAAHLGGLLFGIWYGKYVKKKIIEEYYWWLR